MYSTFESPWPKQAPKQRGLDNVCVPDKNQRQICFDWRVIARVKKGGFMQQLLGSQGPGQVC